MERFYLCHGISSFPFLLLARRKHQVEIVAHILIQICQGVLVAAEIQIDSVQVVIVSINVVVDVKH